MNTPNFTNKICTDKEQSDKLLSLGINPNTADMYIDDQIDEGEGLDEYKQCKVIEKWMDVAEITRIYHPAWSLSRLADMMPVIDGISGDYFTAWILKDENGYKVSYKNYFDSAMLGTHYHDNAISAYIDMMEWTIREGYFSKDYLKKK